MKNPKNALMQKMTDKVMRGGKSPASQKVKTPEYKEFQTDSTRLESGLAGHPIDLSHIQSKYPVDWSGEPDTPRNARALKFLGDAKQGYSGKKYEDSPTKQNYPSTVRGAKKEIRNNPDATADEIATMGWGGGMGKARRKYNRLLKSKHYQKSMELRRDAE